MCTYACMRKSGWMDGSPSFLERATSVKKGIAKYCKAGFTSVVVISTPLSANLRKHVLNLKITTNVCSLLKVP